MPRFFTLSLNNGFLFIFLKDILGLKYECMLACVPLTIALRMRFPNSLGQFRFAKFVCNDLKDCMQAFGSAYSISQQAW